MVGIGDLSRICHNVAGNGGVSARTQAFPFNYLGSLVETARAFEEWVPTYLHESCILGYLP